MNRKSCRNCKFIKNGICVHPDMVGQDSVMEAIIEHVEVAFDGGIQSKLQETIEQYCKGMKEDDKEEFIESICNTCKNHLTDPSNMFLEEEGFMPPYDFFCMNWE